MDLSAFEARSGAEPAAATIQAIVLLYEVAVEEIGNAVAAIEAGDIQGRCRSIDRAFGIITHLFGSLDMERGGEVAENLGRSYRLVLARLVLVGPRNDPRPAQEAIQLLRPLLQAWRQLEAGRLELTPDDAAAARAAYGQQAPAAA